MRRTLLLLSVVALLLGSCGSETDEGQDAEPTGESEASGSVSPSPSTGDSSDSSPTGVTVSDLEGIWVGEVVEPAAGATWDRRLTITECEVGAACGRFHDVDRDHGPDKEVVRCTYSLAYEGFAQDLGAFTFQETVESGPCGPARLAVVPMPDGGLTIGVEEYAEQWGWATYGILRVSGM